MIKKHLAPHKYNRRIYVVVGLTESPHNIDHSPNVAPAANEVKAKRER
jgi:hypothetical protein